jgi:carbon monoxide dehydrogenase subunit G
MTMIRAEYQFRLPVPAQQAFEIISDPTRDPVWQASCLEARLTDGPLGAGCTYEVVFQMLGRRLEFTVEITDFEPGRISRFAVLEGPFRYIGAYEYSDNGDGTTDIHWTFDVDPGEYFGIMPKALLKKVLVSQVKKDISKLNRQLAQESSATARA